MDIITGGILDFLNESQDLLIVIESSKCQYPKADATDKMANESTVANHLEPDTGMLGSVLHLLGQTAIIYKGLALSYLSICRSLLCISPH